VKSGMRRECVGFDHNHNTQGTVVHYSVGGGLIKVSRTRRVFVHSRGTVYRKAIS